MLSRRIAHAGSVARLRYRRRGVGAGSTNATVEMKVLLVRVGRELKLRFNMLMLKNVVDDITLAVAATKRLLLRQIKGALLVCHRRLKELKLVASDKKNQLVSSSCKVVDEGHEAALNHGLVLNIVQQTKLLGTPSSAGRSRPTKALWARLRNFRKSFPRYWVLRVAGAPVGRLLRTGGLRKMTFGQASLGVSNSLLTAQRRSAAAALESGSCGKNVDLVLLFADKFEREETDPAFAAHRDPICKWAEAAWYKRWPPLVMNKQVA